jgi:hypothetical protein
MVVIPLYAVAVVAGIRAGLLDADKPFSDAQAKALWSLLAAGLTSAVTLTGFLLTRAHNLRLLAVQEAADSRQAATQNETERRLVLDSAVKGVGLISAGDGTYAPQAVVAGALATLVHLEHPVIAMRCLSAAWTDRAIDAASAVWLIGEALASDFPESQLEAAALLLDKADLLVREDAAGADPYWPGRWREGWRSDVPIDARVYICEAVVRTLITHPPDWWRGEGLWALSVFVAALDAEVDKDMRGGIAEIVLVFIEDKEVGSVSVPSGWRSYSELREQAEEAMAAYSEPIAPIDELIPAVRRWKQDGRTISEVTPDLAARWATATRLITERRWMPGGLGTGWHCARERHT